MVILLKRKMLLMDKLERVNDLLKNFDSELDDDMYISIMNRKLLIAKEQIAKELREIEERMEG